MRRGPFELLKNLGGAEAAMQTCIPPHNLQVPFAEKIFPVQQIMYFIFFSSSSSLHVHSRPNQQIQEFERVVRSSTTISSTQEAQRKSTLFQEEENSTTSAFVRFISTAAARFFENEVTSGTSQIAKHVSSHSEIARFGTYA